MSAVDVINGSTPAPAARPRAGSRVLALAVFVLLTVVHTWPLATNPAHLSRNDNGDTILNEWAIAWVAHQLPRDPVHLFDANIYYPERLTLGYSEAMIVQGVMGIPLFWAGASPVLAFNLLMMAGFALTGWAFWLLVRRWTGNVAAAYVAGSLAAFNSHVLVRLPHLQTQHLEFIPIVLFALDRVFTSQRIRDAALLGLGFALQGLTSVYLLVFSSWMLGFLVLGRVRDWVRRNPFRTAVLLVFGVAFAALLMSPYLYAYYLVHQVTGFSRTVGDAQLFAGSWLNYLRTGSRLHFALWADRFFSRSESSTFPGVVGLLLVLCALGFRETRRDARVQMCMAAAIGCAAVSFAPHAPFYPLLHRLIPLFSAVRVPAHIGQIVLMMFAVVGGFGVAGMAHRWGSTKAWPFVAAAILILVNVEALRAPIVYTPFDEIPPVYDLLAREPNAVVLEMPFHAPREFFGSGPYMLNSTRYWRPLVNGYSGFRPASYATAYAATRGFPEANSLIAVHALGVTHVVVHGDWYGDAYIRQLSGDPSLVELGASGPIHIYRLK